MSSAAQLDHARGFSMLKPDELDRILMEHKAFLANARNGRRATLISHFLAQADLSNCMLAKADLSGTILTGSNLKFSNFSEATLYCCEMGNVDARYTNFARADMRGVTLSGSNLSHARLDGADFRSGRLLKNSAGIEAVIDRNGSAAGVDFSYCSLNGATFEGADLKGADFTGAMLIGTKFKGAKMNGVVLKDAVLTDVDVSEMQLPPEAFKDCIMPPTSAAVAIRPQILFRLTSHQTWVESDAQLGTFAVLDGMDLRPVATQIGKYKLTAISAKNVIAAGVDFSCTELQGANFEGADLRGASFEGADLRGVRFKGALLHHARFLGADMRPLVLKSGEILETDISETAFTAGQHAEAVFS
ncbi:pentapeptide repeat-containing protein [Rhizomicrobium electricum]|nr:uncharacterized protein YjbI with pentapeptide repeats [Rhizomicrobium electricum]